MVRLEIGNVYTKIVGSLGVSKEEQREMHERLRRELGYMVPGAEWSAAYKTGQWDGYQTTYLRKEQKFLTGCTARIRTLFDELGFPYEMVDLRQKPEKNLFLRTAFADMGRKLHPYQEKTVEVALNRCRGILSLCTGAGKTITSCEIIAQVGVAPFIFFVPAISLLRQTKREFEKYIRTENGETPFIGHAGDGKCNLNMAGVNVLTVQTALAAYDLKYLEGGDKIVEATPDKKSTAQLEAEYALAQKTFERTLTAAMQKGAKDEKVALKSCKKEQNALKKAQAALATRQQTLANKAAIRKLVESALGIIFDEAHTAAIIVQTLATAAENAYYRLGCSGTPWREDNQEIRMEGSMGRKLIEITSSDLIAMGFLVKPKIFMVKVHHIEASDDYEDAQRKHIIECWERNWRIKQAAEAFKAVGRPVLILVNRVEHGRILEEMIQDAVFVAGSDRSGGDDGDVEPGEEDLDYRKRMLNACERNEIILIATQWANVGIDAPAIQVLILAGTGKSSITTYQQVGRVLRRSPETGKTEAVVVDFMDEQKHFHAHSVRRRKIYQNEPEFEVKIIK